MSGKEIRKILESLEAITLDEAKNKCKCGKPGTAPHPCPYTADVHNDSTKLCNCCDACRRECAADI